MILEFKPKKTWREKLEKKQEPVIKLPPKNWIEKYGGEKMLIATPRIIDRFIRQVPPGQLITIGKIRSELARKYQADFTCPLTTGIFVRIAAEAAEEDRENGGKDIAPYWRVTKDDGTLNPKFPGGVEKQAKNLSAEGFEIEKKGTTKLRVKNFEKYLA